MEMTAFSGTWRAGAKRPNAGQVGGRFPSRGAPSPRQLGARFRVSSSRSVVVRLFGGGLRIHGAGTGMARWRRGEARDLRQANERLIALRYGPERVDA